MWSTNHTELQKGALTFLIKINVYFSFEDATNEVDIHKTQSGPSLLWHALCL